MPDVQYTIGCLAITEAVEARTMHGYKKLSFYDCSLKMHKSNGVSLIITIGALQEGCG